MFIKTWLQTGLMVDAAYGCVDARGSKLRLGICETVFSPPDGGGRDRLN